MPFVFSGFARKHLTIYLVIILKGTVYANVKKRTNVSCILQEA